MLTRVVHAEEPAAASRQSLLSRHELWLSLSATLLTAGITGSYALKVAALNDRIAALPADSLEPPQLAQDALRARRLVWGFGTAASLFAITTLLVVVFQPGVVDSAPQLGPTLGLGELGVSYHRRF